MKNAKTREEKKKTHIYRQNAWRYMLEGAN